jgi:hypothetical protein
MFIRFYLLFIISCCFVFHSLYTYELIYITFKWLQRETFINKSVFFLFMDLNLLTSDDLNHLFNFYTSSLFFTNNNLIDREKISTSKDLINYTRGYHRGVHVLLSDRYKNKN